MFSKEKKDVALKVYHQCNSVTKAIRILGYPTRRTLYTWVTNEGVDRPERKTLENINTSQHPRNPPPNVKMEAIRRCFEFGESVKSVSEDIGYTRASIYAWRKKYLKGGASALMNEKNIVPGTLKEGSGPDESLTIRELRAQMADMQLEIDILKETINVLKKDPGVNLEALSNKEKAVIIDAIRNR